MITSHIPLNTRFRIISIMALLVVYISACSLPARRPTDPKTPEEQALINRALEKSTAKTYLELPDGSSIFVKI